jgi:hypothetical protein
MKLEAGIHLAYCTNVHRGETWAETFATLERHTLAGAAPGGGRPPLCDRSPARAESRDRTRRAEQLARVSALA